MLGVLTTWKLPAVPRTSCCPWAPRKVQVQGERVCGEISRFLTNVPGFSSISSWELPLGEMFYIPYFRTNQCMKTLWILTHLSAILDLLEGKHRVLVFFPHSVEGTGYRCLQNIWAHLSRPSVRLGKTWSGDGERERERFLQHFTCPHLDLSENKAPHSIHWSSPCCLLSDSHKYDKLVAYPMCRYIQIHYSLVKYGLIKHFPTYARWKPIKGAWHARRFDIPTLDGSVRIWGEPGDTSAVGLWPCRHLEDLDDMAMAMKGSTMLSVATRSGNVINDCRHVCRWMNKWIEDKWINKKEIDR